MIKELTNEKKKLILSSLKLKQLEEQEKRLLELEKILKEEIKLSDLLEKYETDIYICEKGLLIIPMENMREEIKERLKEIKEKNKKFALSGLINPHDIFEITCMSVYLGHIKIFLEELAKEKGLMDIIGG